MQKQLDITETEPQVAATKTFVEPQLVRHESLPKVTAGFVGTFDP